MKNRRLGLRTSFQAMRFKLVHNHFLNCTPFSGLGQCRQTFYSHNENIEKAIKRTEASLIQDFKLFLDDRPCTGTPARVNSLLITYCFAFMAQRGELFYEICSAMSLQQVLYRMMEVLYPKLQVTWLQEGGAAPAIDSELMDIYFRCMIGVFAWWGKTTKCNANETEPYVRQLLAITRNVTGKNRV